MQVKVPDYGSDQAGVICGFRFIPGGRGKPIEAADAIAWLQHHKSGVPLAQHPNGFWIVVAIVATFTVVAGWYVSRRRRD